MWYNQIYHPCEKISVWEIMTGRTLMRMVIMTIMMIVRIMSRTTDYQKNTENIYLIHYNQNFIFSFRKDSYYECHQENYIQLPITPYSVGLSGLTFNWSIHPNPSICQHARIHRLPLMVFFHRRSSFNEECLPPKVVFHRSCLPPKVIFHRRLYSTEGYLPPKGLFHRRSSSTEDCLPSTVTH